jgi:hypothetical protein
VSGFSLTPTLENATPKPLNSSSWNVHFIRRFRQTSFWSCSQNNQSCLSIPVKKEFRDTGVPEGDDTSRREVKQFSAEPIHREA